MYCSHLNTRPYRKTLTHLHTFAAIALHTTRITFSVAPLKTHNRFSTIEQEKNIDKITGRHYLLCICTYYIVSTLDKYWSNTIWQRTAQDRVTWRRHAEAFAQPRDTTAEVGPTSRFVHSRSQIDLDSHKRS